VTEELRPIDPEELLAHVRPVLHARAKGTVTAALRLIANAAKHDPKLKASAARIAADALIHEAADVQKKALDLIESLGGHEEAVVVAAMQAYADGIAPSVRKRFEVIIGVAGELLSPSAEPGPAPAREVVDIQPVGSFDEFNRALLQVLEGPSKPLEVERAVDGLARFGADKPADFSKIIGPLGKRARAIVKRQPEDRLQYQLARLALAYAENEGASDGGDSSHQDVDVGPSAPHIVKGLRSLL